jgi:hypothetical protein
MDSSRMCGSSVLKSCESGAGLGNGASRWRRWNRAGRGQGHIFDKDAAIPKPLS